MKIRKSIQLYLIFDAILLIILVGLIIAAIRDVQRFGVLTVLILVSVYHFFRYQYRLSKHYLKLEDNRLVIEDEKHSISIHRKTGSDQANRLII